MNLNYNHFELMKKKLLLTLFALLALTVNAQKYVGGDISLLTKYETNGAKYYDKDGVAISDMLTFLKGQGLNAMRVRLFVDPANASNLEKGQGVCQDLDYVKALGKRIKEAGFSLMLDFHYSDVWADPAKQWTPKAWLGLSDEDLYTKIYEYTRDCLKALKDEGVVPDFIQTGNEISYGMLWGEGIFETYNETKREYKYKISSNTYYAGSKNQTRFTNLLKKAGEACREICPKAKIILHTERVPNTNYLDNFYKDMKNAGVDYDIIGLSYYPYYHGSFATLESSLNRLETNYPDKDIMIVETGYYYAWQPTVSSPGVDLSATYPISPEGQQAFTRALIEVLNKHEKVTGLYWWWMEACENGLDWNTKRVSDDWYNASLFNDDAKVNGKDGITYNYPAGKVMPAITELKAFVGGSSGISNLIYSAPEDNIWYDVSGKRMTNKPASKGIYINNKKKVIIK